MVDVVSELVSVMVKIMMRGVVSVVMSDEVIHVLRGVVKGNNRERVRGCVREGGKRGCDERA